MALNVETEAGCWMWRLSADVEADADADDDVEDEAGC